MPPKASSGSKRGWVEPSDLFTAVKLLSGTKGELPKAIDSVIKILSTPSVARRLRDDERGCSWYISVLDSLFEAVLKEKVAISKAESDARAKPAQASKRDVRHPAAASVTRIEQLAEAVRFVIGQSYTMYSKSAFRKVYEHLLQTATDGSRPFVHVCQPYIKALRILLSYHPHVEHMDAKTWKALMNWCWSLLLGDKLDEDQSWRMDEDQSMAIDVILEVHEETPRRAQARASVKGVAIDIFGIISTLLETPTAPIVPSSSTNQRSQNFGKATSTGACILSRITAYLKMYFSETGQHHLPLIRNANLILMELEFNSLSSIIQYGAELLPHLVNLWSTRKVDLRQQVLIAFGILLPHLGRERVLKQSPQAEAIGDQLGKLLTILESDLAGPLSFSPLDMANLRLGLNRHASPFPPLQYRVFSVGGAFTEEMMMTWASMELRGDVTRLLETIAEARRDVELPPSRAAKRRRIEDGIQRLVSAISSSPAGLVALQTISLFVARHWRTIAESTRFAIRQRLVELLGDNDHEVDSWAMICLAAIAAEGEGDNQRGVDGSEWQRLWQHATRRFILPGTCRAAALAMDVLLTCGTVSKTSCRSDIESLLREIDLQGPSFPFDSVCAFLCTVLQYASSDVRMYRMDLGAKVLRWLAGNWSVLHGTTSGFNIRTRVEAHAPADVLRLLAHVCRFEVILPLHLPAWEELLPDCSLASWYLESYHTGPIRRFYLHAELPESREASFSAVVPTVTAELSLPRGIAHQCIVFLEKSCQALIGEWAMASVLQTATPEKVRRSVDVFVLVAAFQALLPFNSLNAAQQTTHLACELLATVSPCLNMTAFGTAGRSLMWRGLAPLLQSTSEGYTAPWQVLLKPTELSGIRCDILDPSHYRRLRQAAAHEETTFRALQIQMWRLQELDDAFANLAYICRSSLESVLNAEDAEEEATQAPMDVDGDDFAQSQFNTSSAIENAAGPGLNEAASTTHRVWVQMLTVGPTISSADLSPVRDRVLLNALINTERDDFMSVASMVFAAAHDGFLRIGSDATEQFLELLQEMLGSYRFSRHQQLHLLVLDFLDATMATWLQPSIIDSELGEFIGQILHFYCDNLSPQGETMWRIRLRFVLLLERYLALDSTLQLWPALRSPGEPHQALETVMVSGSDTDARVRFQSATTCALLVGLDLSPVNYPEPAAIYDKACATFTTSADDEEGFLGTLLFRINVCIASSAVRGRALFEIYAIFSSNRKTVRGSGLKLPYALQSLHGLEAVARTLRLQDLSQLYLAYVTDIIIRQGNGDQRPLHVPLGLYGFKDRKAFAEAILPIAGNFLVCLEDLETFVDICSAAEVEVTSAAAFLAPTVISTAYVASHQPHQLLAGHPDPAKIQAVLRDIYERLSVKQDPFDQTASDAATTIAHVLALFKGSEDLSAATRTLSQCVLQSKEVVSLFQAFLTSDGAAIPVGNVNEPLISMETGLAIIAGFQRQLHQPPTNTQTLVIGLQALAVTMTASPLVAEHRRGMRSIALLFALYQRGADWSLIHMSVFRNLLRLFALVDVASDVLSIVIWVFKISCASRIGAVSSDLANFLAQLGARARLFVAASSSSTRATGRAAQEWLGSLADQYKSTVTLHKPLQHARVLLEAGSGREGVATESILEILRDPAISSDKSPLASVLQTASSKVPLDKVKFSSGTFWLFKASLATCGAVSSHQLAFLDLLHQVGGQVSAPDLEAVDQLSLLKGNAASSLSVKKADAELYAKACLVAIIHEASNNSDPDPALARRAQTSLSSLLHSCPAMMQSTYLPDAVRKELSQLRQAVLLLSSTDHTSIESLRSAQLISKASCFSSWAQEIAILFADVLRGEDVFFDGLKDVFLCDTGSAVNALPYLVHCLLLFDARKLGRPSAKQALSQHFSEVLSAQGTAAEVLDSLLEVMQYLRHFMPAGSADPQAFETWLEIDFYLLSRCAVRCGKFATALFYLERAHEDGRLSDKAASSGMNEILYAVYSNVEDPDGFYGVKSTDIKSSLVQRYHHEERWSQALEQHGATFQTRAPDNFTTKNVLASLDALGFHRIAGHIISSARSDEQGHIPEVDPLEYEIAWRNGDWDVPTSTPSTNSDARQLLYHALRSVHRDRDHARSLQTIHDLIGSKLQSLRRLGLESITQTREAVRTLLCLREIASCLVTHAKNGQFVAESHETEEFCDFTTTEAVLSTRISVLQAFRAQASRTSIGSLGPASSLLDAEKTTHLRISQVARGENRVQAAINAITAAQVIEKARPASITTSQNEYSQVLWAQGEFSLAIQLVTDLCSVSGSKATSSRSRKSQVEEAKLRARLATWTYSAKLEPPEAIRGHYRQAFKQVEGNSEDAACQAAISHSFAVFLDRQHDVLIKSTDLQRLRTYRDRKKTQLSNLERQAKSSVHRGSPEIQSMHDSTLQELQADEEALKEMEKSTKDYLHQALKMYSNSLAQVDSFNDSIIRLVTLWLEHSQDPEIPGFMRERLLSDIPSWKFVFLGPQLAARLSRLPAGSMSKFQDTLNGLMLRLSRDHPYHVLYQVITLASSSSSNKRPATHATNLARGEAAVEILRHLEAEPDGAMRSSRQTAADMKIFSASAVKWCTYKVTDDPKSLRGEPTLPLQCPMLAVKHLSIPIATAPLPVDPTASYPNIPTLQRYSSRYKVAGGLSRPTILSCTDSDGRRHIQLFKRGDDVRKDAVMEQVFATVNDLLVRDKRAKDRHLRFRTYAVIPLADNNGLIEFVGNTQAIGDWLIPAHRKYRKSDMSPEEFRKGIKDLQEKDPFSSQIAKRWVAQMQRFHPVMRHFFVERHKDPMAWHTMRLAYTRSVAVTSMVGHMVGLGDRHCSNILIDRMSGELVHIDLGIAFEEGLDLRIPERVPFRLSNDIVDGMGMAGVDGTFRRCSQETMRVLREYSSLIMTVLEVFKHDPLQAWTATPEKIARLQAERGGHKEPALADAAPATSEKADRILARVASKLQPDLSVEYTVNQLIQEARDPERLATIYTGWQSWL